MSDCTLGMVIVEPLLIVGSGGGPSSDYRRHTCSTIVGCGYGSRLQTATVKAFRAPAVANSTTWQIDSLRWETIGLGSTHRVALQSIAFLLFAVTFFLYAARCLQGQE